jgi:hypothetical protein
MFLVALLAIVPVGKLGFIELSGSNRHGSYVGSIGSVGLLLFSLVGFVFIPAGVMRSSTLSGLFLLLSFILLGVNFYNNTGEIV